MDLQNNKLNAHNFSFFCFSLNEMAKVLAAATAAGKV